jgi:glycosyltransferase involved in cell wall biosynthesis
MIQELPPEMLSIIIPAYNEEEAIGNTIRMTIEAIPSIKAEAEIDDVEIVVVSDGSSDQTVSIAETFIEKGIQLIHYEKNRGYGAAIKTGFRTAKGCYLGFLDADGTCNPSFFGKLVREMKTNNANIALGSRLHKESRMPLVRRIGNLVYASILSILSGSIVTDSASGMRVLNKNCMEWIDLLPDGLHFTPAMSTIATLDSGLKISEIPMPYEERSGESKLNVFSDGVRFLNVILGTAFSLIPSRFFLACGLFALLIASYLSVPVLIKYYNFRSFVDGDIYRIITIICLVSIGISAILFGVLTSNFIRLLEKIDFMNAGTFTRLMNRFYLPNALIIFIATTFSGIYLIYPGISTYLSQGIVTIHWIFILTALFNFWIGSNTLFCFFIYRLQRIMRNKLILLKQIH